MSLAFKHVIVTGDITVDFITTISTVGLTITLVLVSYTSVNIRIYKNHMSNADGIYITGYEIKSIIIVIKRKNL